MEKKGGIGMLYNDDRLVFQLLTIGSFRHTAGVFRVQRPFASISFRLSGQGAFRVGEETFTSRVGDVTFLPQDSAYTVEYSVGESIAVHLTECSYRAVENITPKSTEQVKECFEELLRIKDDPARTNGMRALIYRTLQILSDDARSGAGERAIERCVAHIDRYYADPALDIASLFRVGAVSEATLRRMFRRYYGISPQQYLMRVRLGRAADLLVRGDRRVCEVAEACGFSDEKYFSRCIKQHYGIPPSAMKQGGDRET